MSENVIRQHLSSIRASREEEAARYHGLRYLITRLTAVLCRNYEFRNLSCAIQLFDALWMLAHDCYYLSCAANEGEKNPFDFNLFQELVEDRQLIKAHLDAVPKTTIGALVALTKGLQKSLTAIGLDIESEDLFDLAVESWFAGELERNPDGFRQVWNKQKLKTANSFQAQDELELN